MGAEAPSLSFAHKTLEINRHDKESKEAFTECESEMLISNQLIVKRNHLYLMVSAMESKTEQKLLNGKLIKEIGSVNSEQQTLKRSLRNGAIGIRATSDSCAAIEHIAS